MTDTDSGKIFDMAVKGSTVISSLRKISKTINTVRIFSCVVLSVIVLLNVFSVINTIKQ